MIGLVIGFGLILRMLAPGAFNDFGDVIAYGILCLSVILIVCFIFYNIFRFFKWIVNNWKQAVLYVEQEDRNKKWK